jgi:ankyrin repeat protein
VIQGFTALCYAASSGRLEVVSLLLRKGAAINWATMVRIAYLLAVVIVTVCLFR